MNHIIVKIFAGLMTIIFVGCSVKNAPAIVHQQPIETSVADTKPNPGLLATLNFDSVNVVLSGKPSAQSVLDKTILPLAKVLLSPATYNSSAVSDPKFLEGLKRLNSAIMYVQQVAPTLLAQSTVLRDYKAAVLVDCDQDLIGQCPNLSIYSVEGRFARIVMILAAQEKGILQYYRILRIAKERFAGTADSQLDFMYLQRANELIDFYVEATDKDGTQKLTAVQKDELKLHANLTQTILVNFDPSNIANKTQVRAMISAFNPWDMSRRTGNVLNIGMDRILAMAANDYLYSDRAGGVLNQKDFVDKVQMIMNGDNSFYGLGIWQIYNLINKSPSHDILRNLKLLDKPVANEYSYLVDRVYYSHFTIDDGIAFWRNTRQDRAALFQAIGQFMRLQIAYMIVWTNQQMNDFFASNVDSNGKIRIGNIFTLLSQAVDNSQKLHGEWDRFIQHVGNLEKLVDREYGSVSLLTLDANDPYRTYKDSMTNLGTNIKMLSVFPNMMMLAYLMAHENFHSTVMGAWKFIEVTAESVLENLFIVSREPWFSFATDQDALSEVQVLYALHFTMQTETFSGFKDNPLVKPFDNAKFLAEITEKLTRSIFTDLTDRLNALTKFLGSNAPDINLVLRSCQQERALQAYDALHEVYTPRRYLRSMTYDDMSYELAHGFGFKSNDSPMKTIAQLYALPLDDDSKPGLRQMRTAIEQRFLSLRNIRDILMDYLREHGGETKTVNDAFDAKMGEVLNLRNQYLQTLHQTMARIGDCDIVLYKHEMDLRNMIYAKEEAYLGQVWDNLNKINTGGGNAKALNKDLASFAQSITELPDAYRNRGGNDRYVRGEQGFRYDHFAFDSTMRMRQYLQELAPGTTVSIPNFNQIDTAVNYQSPKAHPMEPADLGSRAAFIADGMQEFTMVTGLEDKITPAFLTDKLELMAQLYRMGPIYSQSGQLDCPANLPSGRGPQCSQITAKQLIDLNFSILKISDLSQNDIKVLGWLSKREKFSPDFWTQLAMQIDSRRALGLLDVTFQRVASDTPAITGTIQSFFFDLTETYFDNETALGKFLFPPSDRINGIIKANYKKEVRDYLARTDGFLRAYREAQNQDPYNMSHIRTSLDQTISVPSEINSKSLSVPQYISNGQLRRYNTLTTTFHNRTDHEFEH